MNTPLIDIGCNLASARLYHKHQEIIARAEKKGVLYQIITGSDRESNERALSLALKYPTLYATLGFHPHHACDWNPLKHCPQHLLIGKEKAIVAIGEMGLDYFRNLSTPYSQIRSFIDQLQIAQQLQKPVFLHERHAFQDFKSILEEHLQNLKGALWHCFTGNGAQLEWALEKGLYIGITGWLNDPERGKTLRDIVHLIPNDRLMIETDAPYLTPKTLKPMPKINEPQYLPEILNLLAKIRKQNPETLAQHTTKNAINFFQLSNIVL